MFGLLEGQSLEETPSCKHGRMEERGCLKDCSNELRARAQRAATEWMLQEGLVPWTCEKKRKYILLQEGDQGSGSQALMLGQEAGALSGAENA